MILAIGSHASILNAASGWNTAAGDYSATRYSDEVQINRQNVSSLKRAWVYKIEKYSGVDPSVMDDSIESTPVFTKKLVISVNLAGQVYGLNPITGAEVWKTNLPASGGRRGISYSNGFVYVGTPSGTYQIDSDSGKITNKYGVSLSLLPPIIVGDNVYIANYVDGISAYQTVTAELLWTRPLKSNCGLGRVWSGFSYDNVTDNLFVTTGNSGALMRDDPNNCWANSVIAVARTDGQIAWSFQEFERDMWDLDMVSNPNITNVKINGKISRAVVALSKTGNIFMLEAVSGKLMNGVEVLTSSGAIKVVNPEMRLGTLRVDKRDVKATYDVNQDYIERKISRLSDFNYQGATLEQPIFMYGLHGGFEWPGGSISKVHNTLVVTTNHYPWAIRIAHNYADREQLRRLVAESKTLTGYCVDCHSDDLLGRTASELDKSGAGSYIPAILGQHAHRAKVTSDLAEFKHSHKFSVHEVESFFNLKASYQRATGLGWRIAKKLDRTLNSDWVHNFFVRLFKLLRPFNENSSYLEDNLGNINAATLDLARAEMRHITEQLIASRWVPTANWQMMTDLQDQPVTSPPWGLLSAIDLNSQSLIWQVPFGYETDKLGNKVLGSRNIGGVLTTKSDIIFATGAADKMARAYDIATGAELWSDPLVAAGSAPPMTYTFNGCQYVIFNATGGRFSFFGPNTRDIQLAAYNLPGCDTNQAAE
jgi:quinoprotein glucose dehydrogenase